jgi:NADH-quinone oxidoreductase subunit F
MEKILLHNVDKPDSHKIDTYLAGGGYDDFKKSLGMGRDDLVQLVKDSGLRGRGGAGFPAGLKWSFIPKDPTLQKYLCCNADEGEPGTFKDRIIIEKDPHLLLEGMAITCYAINADKAYIYIRGEFEYGAQVLEEAIKEAYAKGYLGKNILGTDFSLDMYVHRGYGSYICGEETALLESIEGYRGQPRKKPPFPALAGLNGKPTVVNNVESLACLPAIIRKGPKWFANIGPEKSPGPKLFCVSGHVEKPGVYELPMGTTLREIVYEVCGGVKNGKKFKAVIPGGVTAPMLVEENLDLSMDFETMSKADSMLGSGAVIVMDDTTCMVRTSYIINRFFSHESCGKCTPCREGVTWMTQILKRMEGGEGRPGDLEELERLCDNIFGRTFCPLGDGAVMALRGCIKHFREEFLYHEENGRCMV